MGVSSKSVGDSYAHLCNLLNQHRKVYFGRYGDGEIYTMLGSDCLEHKASSELSSALREAFMVEDPLYLRAVGVNYPVEKGMVHGLFAPYIDNFQLEKDLLEHLAVPDGAVFENQVLFHYLSVFRPALMNEFLDTYIRNKRLMFVGSTPQPVVEKIFGRVAVHVQVPARDAFYNMDEWFPEVEKNAGEMDVIIPSAGVTSKIIAYRLWERGVETHCLDIGSLIDAVHGKSSRKWIKLMGHRVNNIVLPASRNRSLRFRLLSLFRELRFIARTVYRGRNYKMPYR